MDYSTRMLEMGEKLVALRELVNNPADLDLGSIVNEMMELRRGLMRDVPNLSPARRGIYFDQLGLLGGMYRDILEMRRIRDLKVAYSIWRDIQNKHRKGEALY